MSPEPRPDSFNSDISVEGRLDVGGQDDEIEEIWREEQSRTLKDVSLVVIVGTFMCRKELEI